MADGVAEVGTGGKTNGTARDDSQGKRTKQARTWSSTLYMVQGKRAHGVMRRGQFIIRPLDCVCVKYTQRLQALCNDDPI